MMIGLFINTRQQRKHNKDTINSINLKLIKIYLEGLKQFLFLKTKGNKKDKF